MHTSFTRLTTALLSKKDNVNGLYEYIRALASLSVNLVIVPPDEFRTILAHVKQDMKVKPRLELMRDPEKYIWAYYF